MAQVFVVRHNVVYNKEGIYAIFLSVYGKSGINSHIFFIEPPFELTLMLSAIVFWSFLLIAIVKDRGRGFEMKKVIGWMKLTCRYFTIICSWRYFLCNLDPLYKKLSLAFAISAVAVDVFLISLGIYIAHYGTKNDAALVSLDINNNGISATLTDEDDISDRASPHVVFERVYPNQKKEAEAEAEEENQDQVSGYFENPFRHLAIGSEAQFSGSSAATAATGSPNVAYEDVYQHDEDKTVASPEYIANPSRPTTTTAMFEDNLFCMDTQGHRFGEGYQSKENDSVSLTGMTDECSPPPSPKRLRCAEDLMQMVHSMSTPTRKRVLVPSSASRGAGATGSDYLSSALPQRSDSCVVIESLSTPSVALQSLGDGKCIAVGFEHSNPTPTNATSAAASSCNHRHEQNDVHVPLLKTVDDILPDAALQQQQQQQQQQSSKIFDSPKRFYASVTSGREPVLNSCLSDSSPSPSPSSAIASTVAAEAGTKKPVSGRASLSFAGRSSPSNHQASYVSVPLSKSSGGRYCINNTSQYDSSVISPRASRNSYTAHSVNNSEERGVYGASFGIDHLVKDQYTAPIVRHQEQEEQHVLLQCVVACTSEGRREAGGGSVEETASNISEDHISNPAVGDKVAMWDIGDAGVTLNSSSDIDGRIERREEIGDEWVGLVQDVHEDVLVAHAFVSPVSEERIVQVSDRDSIVSPVGNQGSSGQSDDNGADDFESPQSPLRVIREIIFDPDQEGDRAGSDAISVWDKASLEDADHHIWHTHAARTDASAMRIASRSDEQEEEVLGNDDGVIMTDDKISTEKVMRTGTTSRTSTTGAVEVGRNFNYSFASAATASSSDVSDGDDDLLSDYDDEKDDFSDTETDFTATAAAVTSNRVDVSVTASSRAVSKEQQRQPHQQTEDIEDHDSHSTVQSEACSPNDEATTTADSLHTLCTVDSLRTHILGDIASENPEAGSGSLVMGDYPDAVIEYPEAEAGSGVRGLDLRELSFASVNSSIGVVDGLEKDIAYGYGEGAAAVLGGSRRRLDSELPGREMGGASVVEDDNQMIDSSHASSFEAFAFASFIHTESPTPSTGRSAVNERDHDKMDATTIVVGSAAASEGEDHGSSMLSSYSSLHTVSHHTPDSVHLQKAENSSPANRADDIATEPAAAQVTDSHTAPLFTALTAFQESLASLIGGGPAVSDNLQNEGVSSRRAISRCMDTANGEDNSDVIASIDCNEDEGDDLSLSFSDDGFEIEDPLALVSDISSDEEGKVRIARGLRDEPGERKTEKEAATVPILSLTKVTSYRKLAGGEVECDGWGTSVSTFLAPALEAPPGATTDAAVFAAVNYNSATTGKSDTDIIDEDERGSERDHGGKIAAVTAVASLDAASVDVIKRSDSVVRSKSSNQESPLDSGKTFNHSHSRSPSWWLNGAVGGVSEGAWNEELSPPPHSASRQSSKKPAGASDGQLDDVVGTMNTTAAEQQPLISYASYATTIEDERFDQEKEHTVKISTASFNSPSARKGHSTGSNNDVLETRATPPSLSRSPSHAPLQSPQRKSSVHYLLAAGHQMKNTPQRRDKRRPSLSLSSSSSSPLHTGGRVEERSSNNNHCDSSPITSASPLPSLSVNITSSSSTSRLLKYASESSSFYSEHTPSSRVLAPLDTGDLLASRSPATATSTLLYHQSSPRKVTLAPTRPTGKISKLLRHSPSSARKPGTQVPSSSSTHDGSSITPPRRVAKEEFVTDSPMSTVDQSQSAGVLDGVAVDDIFQRNSVMHSKSSHGNSNRESGGGGGLLSYAAAMYGSR